MPLLLLALLPGCLPAFPERTLEGDPLGDWDQDGVTLADGDCDDASPSVGPGFPEVCDQKDNDCDGETDEISDDDGVYVVDAPSWYGDEDGDGYGIDSYVVTDCAQPEGFASEGGDCDDGSPSIFPGANEVCGGRDDDCDGLVDEPGADGLLDEKTWYLDGDSDGWGTEETTYVGCEPPQGYAYDAGDCDDTSRQAYPGADEVCDGVDNDCDGLTDDDDDGVTGLATWYRDDDGDGWGIEGDTAEACDAPEGYAAADGDCDDANATILPGAAETCDEVDQDCDGRTDEGAQLDVYRDADGDGYGNPDALALACAPSDGWVLDATDCDDGDADIHPDADELCATVGIDDDCDGFADESDAADVEAWYADSDGDGYGDPEVAEPSCEGPAFYVADASDCDDARATVNPSATERCSTAGVDEDCDGSTNDADADGCSAFYVDA
ncbi:MAG: putative metal-binding motif-containing protein, partial [Deltaproteobacteria bacterium]|nr:putative metal-binding motif-containing protein [Deltaproteobacteria bacterium]